MQATPSESQNDLHDRCKEREVTDPVTHLPITIHDNTSLELQPIISRSGSSRFQKLEQGDQHHGTMDSLVQMEASAEWWNDDYSEDKRRIQTAMTVALATGVGGIGSLWLLWIVSAVRGRPARIGLLDVFIGSAGCCILALGLAVYVFVYYSLPQLPLNQPAQANANEHPIRESQTKGSHESAAWLNSLLHSLWPIVNPQLFVSVADQLEDSMQAALPKFIHGVRVAEIGQGSEPMRVLGIRWLDAGDAAVENAGMKAEEGDFVNLEIAVAYRARYIGSGLKKRSANAHLFIQFSIVGGITIPVWVDLTGFIATARFRIQLTPNPPFFSVLTLTLLGQPKIKLSCTPLAKSLPNVMDVPGLSGWLQSCVDAVAAGYVAPRSLTLDLKTLLMGREKMDTDAVGVVFVHVRSAKGFKTGDGVKFWENEESRRGDPYVTLGWGKWGKPIWSTRIIDSEAEPVWEETTALLVGPAEMNAGEKLRLQLWDSDHLTADDVLGTVEVTLKDIITGSETQNKIASREDRFTDIDGTRWPGTLRWDVGYFAKTTFQQHLTLEHKDASAIEKRIEKEAEEKLREAKTRDDGIDESGEIEQQKKEDLKEKTNEIIAGLRPREEWPSGVLSILIEQINGLEIERVQESGVKEGAEDEEDDDLPSSYCTIIINHQRVYKTRTKLKDRKPYFNAGTERYIKDWRSTTVIISVRDSRTLESDALLGIVVLPLRKLFMHRSQVTDVFPLVGGIGFGRMRLSMAFRSVQANLPRELLGWDIGTLEIMSQAHASIDLPPDLTTCRLVLRTLYGKGKLHPQSNGYWKQKKDRPVHLAVNKRYSSCLLVQFRKHSLGPDQTPAFCTLWLKDIPDDELVEISLPVRRNAGRCLKRAQSNATHEIGERVGTVSFKVRLWPGLSGYHQYLADKDKHVADVMEVLDCAEESAEISKNSLFDEDADSSDSDSSNEERKGRDNENDQKVGDVGDEEKRGVKDEFSAYKKKGQLHRKHRGMMQWKGVRNLAWIGREVEHAIDKVEDKVEAMFKHQDREPAVEKEA